MHDIEFIYKENKEFEFNFKMNSFVTFLGDGSYKLLNNLMFRKKHDFISLSYLKINEKNISKYKKEVMFLLHEHINLFIGETVRDEIAYGMENMGVSKSEMEEKINHMAREFGISHLLMKDGNSLSVSEKVIVKIISALLCEVKVLVLYEVLCEIDDVVKELVVSKLKDYVSRGNIIFNFTSDVRESLYGSDIVIVGNDKVLISGKTLNVLNEDRLLKKLGIGLPFIVEINKYLMDYGIVKKYELDMDKLVGEIWK